MLLSAINGEATFLSLQDKVDMSFKSGRETASPLSVASPLETASPLSVASPVELRVVSDHFGAELE